MQFIEHVAIDGGFVRIGDIGIILANGHSNFNQKIYEIKTK